MMADTFKINIKEVGLRRTLAAFKAIEPELSKELHEDLRGAVQPILNKAKSQMASQPLPMSNYNRWQRRGQPGPANDISFQPDVMSKGYGLIDRFGKRVTRSDLAMFTLINRSAPGAIYELAGVNAKSNPDRTKFLRTLRRRTGKQAPRGLIHTWREEKGITKFYKSAVYAAEFVEERIQKMINNG